MQEIAVLSYDPLLLNFRLKEGYRQAKRVLSLLQSSRVFFLSIIIAVEFCFHMGSEFSRRMCVSIGINEFFAPVFYMPMVVLFGELIPLFIARKCPELAIFLGIDIVFLFSRLINVFIAIMDMVIYGIFCVFGIGRGTKKEKSSFIKREDVIIAIRDCLRSDINDDVDRGAHNVFSIQKDLIKKLAVSLKSIPVIGLDSLNKCRSIFINKSPAFILCHHEELLRVVFSKHIMYENLAFDDLFIPPIVSENSTIMSILINYDFKKTPVILSCDEYNKPQGWFGLGKILSYVFGDPSSYSKSSSSRFVEKTFDESITIGELADEFGVYIKEDREKTIPDVLKEKLGVNPMVGEKFIMDDVDVFIEWDYELSTQRIRLIFFTDKYN